MIEADGPSPNLRWEELGCKDGTPYPEKWRSNRARLLAAEFELIRSIIGGPIAILSAYRTEEHNKKVGGARNSQHVVGKALDLRCPKGWTPTRMALVVKALVKDGKSRIKGLGIYPWGIHIDIRTAPELVVWSSNGQKES